MKECRSCKIDKNESEFYERKSNSDGLYSYCKDCTLRKNKEKREKNLDRYNQANRDYKEKNRLSLKEKAKKYYLENRESCLVRAKIYREKNKKEISFKEALKRLDDEDRFEKNRRKHLAWSSKNRKTLNEYQKIWYSKNKDKRRAHVALSRAVQSGKIMRPKNCFECEKECKPDGHHTDYSKPLEVIWICRACHSRKSPRTVIK